MCRLTAKGPAIRESSVASTVLDEVAHEVSLKGLATPPKVAQVPSWMWAKSEMPAVADTTTLVRSPAAVRVAHPDCPEPFSSPNAMMSDWPASATSPQLV